MDETVVGEAGGAAPSDTSSGTPAPATGTQTATPAAAAGATGETALDTADGGAYAEALAAAEADWSKGAAAFATTSPDDPASRAAETYDPRSEIAALKAQLAELTSGRRDAAGRSPGEPYTIPNPAEDGPAFVRELPVVLQRMIGEALGASLDQRLGPLREEMERGRTANFAALGDYAVGQQVHALLAQPEFAYANPTEVNAAIGEFCNKTQRLPTTADLRRIVGESHKHVARIVHEQQGKFLKGLRERVRPAVQPPGGESRAAPVLRIDPKRIATREGRAEEAANALRRARRGGGDF